MKPEIPLIIIKILGTVILLSCSGLLVNIVINTCNEFLARKRGLMSGIGRSLKKIIADFLKLIFKERTISHNIKPTTLFIAVAISMILAFLPGSLLPFGVEINLLQDVGNMEVLTINPAILYLFLFLFLGSLHKILPEWISNNKVSMIGIWRFLQKQVYIELVMLIIFLSVYINNRSGNLHEIVVTQTGQLWGIIPRWGIFVQPVGAILFFFCILVNNGLFPFDDEKNDILSDGFHGECLSIKYLLYKLSANVYLATMILVFIMVFLGGYETIWVPDHSEVVFYKNIQVLRAASMLIKLLIATIVVSMSKWGLARFKVSQFVNFAKYYLLPLAIFDLLMSTFCLYFKAAF